MKIALVQDWLVVVGGAESVFKEIAGMFPHADIFSLVANKETIDALGLSDRKLTTSFIQRLPFATTKYRMYLPLFPLAIEQFDLSTYDLVISSSYAVAKGVLTHPGQTHICYCHSPMRYAWDLYHLYMRESGLERGLKGLIAKLVLHRIRLWDVMSVNRVDYFIANSKYIQKRIKKIYNRTSEVIYPNVHIDRFVPQPRKADFYVTCSRLVPYKKIDLIVQAFAQMPEKRLIVIGDGPEYEKIKRAAKGNVEMLGYQPFDKLKRYLSEAKAFIFAAEEDFGITPVEAQACGTPVIAFRKGGATETVIEYKTGVFFDEQTTVAITQAVKFFEQNQQLFNTEDILKNAEKFSAVRFKMQLSDFINRVLRKDAEDILAAISVEHH